MIDDIDDVLPKRLPNGIINDLKSLKDLHVAIIIFTSL